MRLDIAVAALVGGATGAHAAQTPKYEPAPAWVAPAPPIKTAATFGSPMFAVMDQQTRIADGVVWSYREIASRALSADALTRLGTLSLSWQPDKGDLVIHRVDIVRDGRRIDVLKAGQRFSVIRREQSLEKFEMNGVLTATLQVEGLQVGDVLDVAYSASAKDPALKGGVQATELALAEPLKVDFARARMIWPSGAPIRWKGHLSGLKASESDASGWHQLEFASLAPKQPDVPNDAPARFKPLPVIEASSFADWQAVSAVFAPLYDPKGLIAPGSPLAQEVARIRTAESDPKRRAAAALALVQDRVRYFANGMNGGNYTPQSPTRTWSAGYGDCKAKTLLLLALLHELGIEAEPVLASIGQDDLVAIRLPSPGAFNHILVHATVGGADMWLDGTGRGSRLEDLGDPPTFRTVLPVRAAGAMLVQLPSKAPARPTRTVVVDIDESAAIGVPAPFTATVGLRGAAADALRSVVAQLDNEHLLALALALTGGAAGPNAVPVTQAIAFNDAQSTATITVTGIARPAWRRQDHAYRLRPVSGVTNFVSNSDRSRPAWKDMPVSTGEPANMLVTTRFHLPDGGRGISVEGGGALDVDVAGRGYGRKTTLAADLLTIEERSTTSGAELAPAELPAARTTLASAQSRALRVGTDAAYPAVYQQLSSASKTHKLDKLEALYTTLIASKPDDASRYVNRAAFYEASFRRDLALADLDRAVSLDGTAATILHRAGLLEVIGEKDKAAGDYRTVLGIDPSSKAALTHLGLLEIDAGKKDAALTSVEEHVAKADDDKPDWLLAEAELKARMGDAHGALALMDQAVAIRSANATLLNQRCWIKGTLSTELENAVQDCTRAIELSENNAQAFDSRALVYLRLNRLEDALADINAALDRRPLAAASLYLRAVIERRMGRSQEAEADAGYARLLAPRIDEEYSRWKIKA